MVRLFSLDMFLIVCLMIIVRNSNGGKQKTWIESALRCTLANMEEIEELNSTFPKSWIGGYYLTTNWIAYTGCFKQVKALEGPTSEMNDNSPAKCLDHCKDYKLFALRNDSCFCLKSKSGLITTSPENCDLECSDPENRDVHGATCGSDEIAGYVDVYLNTHKSTIQTPWNNNNQYLQCTTVSLSGEGTITFKASRCDDKYKILCRFDNGVIEALSNETHVYRDAIKQCNMFDFTRDRLNITAAMKIKDKYWTNIRRFQLQHWQDNETDSAELKGKLKRLKNTKCLTATKYTGFPVGVVPLPCNNKLPYICSPLHENNIKDDALENGNVTIIYENTTYLDVTVDSDPFHSTDSLISTLADEITQVADSSGNGHRGYISELYVLQIGAAIFMSLIVIIIVSITLFKIRPWRGQYTLPRLEDEDKDDNELDDMYLSVEPEEEYDDTNYLKHLGLEWIPTQMEAATMETRLPEVRSVDKSLENSDNEYHHLDFSVKPTEEPEPINENLCGTIKLQTTDCKYAQPVNKKCEIVPTEEELGTYDNPWDEEKSKLNRVFTHFREGLVRGGREIRNSIFRRQSRAPKFPGINCDAYGNAESKPVYDVPKVHTSPLEDGIETLPSPHYMNTSEVVTCNQDIMRRKKSKRDANRRLSLKEKFQHVISMSTFTAQQVFESARKSRHSIKSRTKSGIYSFSKQCEAEIPE